MSNTALESGIPILTEVIPAASTDVIPGASTEAPVKPLAQLVKPVPVPAPAPMPEVVDVPLIDGWLTEEWNRLERKIGGRILHEVMERIESEIEDRVRDVLADVLQVAVESMATEVKQNLRQTLEGLIGQAVHQEIANMQIAKK